MRAVVLDLEREVKEDASCKENIPKTLLLTFKEHSRANNFLRRKLIITSSEIKRKFVPGSDLNDFFGLLILGPGHTVEV